MLMDHPHRFLSGPTNNPTKVYCKRPECGRTLVLMTYGRGMAFIAPNDDVPPFLKLVS